MDGYSLKSDNKLPLFGLIVGNIVIFYGVIQSDRIIVGDWVLLGQQMVEVLPAGLALALVGIINAQLSPEAKARIVFMRWEGVPNSVAGWDGGLSSYYATSSL